SGNWDDGGRDISKAVDWLTDNVAKFKGDPKRMFIWAHSAGNGPLGVYIGHGDRWSKGVAVEGAIFMSGNPFARRGGGGGGGRGAGAPGAGRGAGGPGGAAGGPQAGAACGMVGTALGAEGAIAGPSSARAGGAGAGRGAGGGRGAAQPLTPEQQAERDNL